MAVLGAGEEKERVQSKEGGVERASLQKKTKTKNKDLPCKPSAFAIRHFCLNFLPPGKASPTSISMGPGPVETASSLSRILHPVLITASIKLHGSFMFYGDGRWRY